MTEGPEHYTVATGGRRGKDDRKQNTLTPVRKCELTHLLSEYSNPDGEFFVIR
jgi:hypothetical protein